MKDKLDAFLGILCLLLLIYLIYVAFSYFRDSNILNKDKHAQCESVGGVYGGSKCYINGELVDLENE